MIAPAELDLLMHRAWPGLESIEIDGWLARLAGGVTNRANSVLPLRCPRDLDRALARVEALYAERGLPPTFQISPAAESPELDSLLAERGYELRAPTLVQKAAADIALKCLPPPHGEIEVAEEPDEAWMDCWWSVDGRGGDDARAIARRILLACPALYVTLRHASDVAAVGRLALIEDCGGIYCMAVREDARRRGQGTAVLRALVEAGVGRGVRRLWLQVVESNHAARALYDRAGFIDASRYHYRVRSRSR
jgi:ribosomal protein S18 acetylase RimI-like enzyme